MTCGPGMRFSQSYNLPGSCQGVWGNETGMFLEHVRRMFVTSFFHFGCRENMRRLQNIENKSLVRGGSRTHKEQLKKIYIVFTAYAISEFVFVFHYFEKLPKYGYTKSHRKHSTYQLITLNTLKTPSCISLLKALEISIKNQTFGKLNVYASL